MFVPPAPAVSQYRFTKFGDVYYRVYNMGNNTWGEWKTLGAIADNSLSGAKLTDGSVSGTKLTDGTVANSKLSDTYFRLFTERVTRLMDHVKSLRDYTVQLRELFSTQLDIRMNRIMTVLTIITAIFMPLTLIAGWYGMNFTFMPELQWKYSYPIVFLVSLTILIGGIAWFRKKKWL